MAAIHSVFQESLPLHAEVDEERDAADQRHSAAKRRNNRQSQQVADWSRLELLLRRGTIVQEPMCRVLSSKNDFFYFFIFFSGAHLQHASPQGWRSRSGDCSDTPCGFLHAQVSRNRPAAS